MVVDIDLSYTHNGKYAPYVEVCGLQGLELEYKGHTLSQQPRQTHTSRMVKMPCMLRNMVPRAPNTNVTSMFFLSNHYLNVGPSLENSSRPVQA